MVVLTAGLILSAARGYALDFYGADVSDRDVPSSYFRVGLFGIRPIVVSVAFDSVAAKAGLQRGDIILSINGTDVKKSSELSRFTSNLLSVSIRSGSEMKVLSIERLAPGAAKTRSISADKAATDQSRVGHDVPAAVIKAPAAMTGSRASEIDNRRSSTAAAPQHQTSREVLPRNPSLDVSIQGRSRKEKLDRAIREASENLARSEGRRPSDKSVAATPVLPQAGTTKGDIFTSPIKPANDKFVLENSKGDVTFRHSIHQKSLNKEQCMLCHRTSNSTLESIQSRLDSNRAGHSFCRGCHQKMDQGPTTECHLCHTIESRN